MNETLDRLQAAAKRVLRRKIYPIAREEWQSTMHATGAATRLNQPLSLFASISGKVKVVVSASSSPQSGPAGFHIVREDPPDAPNIYNTDSYDEIDLRSHKRWSEIVSVAGLAKSDADRLFAKYVFLVSKKRADHHSPTIPSDIANAKPK
ncbi:MAG TPA: hypothetical protein VGQ36_10725 [Thermoanaerobaculia bacterium]|jgi:hypothetical protein|nr:hypothetical protein [Thermoanaerobaculia bacterium]